MAWVKVDDQATDHPKFLALGRDRLAGTGLWLVTLVYANRYTTDGFVPAGALPANSAALAKRLVDVGLLEPVEGGFAIHDYHDYQLSRDEVDGLRATRAEAGRIGGLRSGRSRRSKRQANGEATAIATASDAAKQTRKANANPVPVPDPVETLSLEENLVGGGSPNGRQRPRDGADGVGERPDVAYLKRRGWKRVTAKQLRVLDSIANNERRSVADVRSGHQWCADVMARTPEGHDPLKYLMAKEARLKAQRLRAAEQREAEWEAVKEQRMKPEAAQP